MYKDCEFTLQIQKRLVILFIVFVEKFTLSQFIKKARNQAIRLS